jgi:hypothetical protein
MANTKRATESWLVLLFLFGWLPSLSAAGPPPIITSQPTDQTVIYGGTVTFEVSAMSATALSYQWYKDGLLICDQLLPGQTYSNAVLDSVGYADVGQYFVRVSNAGGTVTSRKASLVVVPNSQPSAKDDFYSTPEATGLFVPPAGVLGNDSDANGQAPTALLVTDVPQGILTLRSNGSFAYSPPVKYVGTVSFGYCAVDGVVTVVEQNKAGSNKQAVRFGERGAQSFHHGAIGDPDYVISKVMLYLSTETPKPDADLIFEIGTGINTGEIPGSRVAISPSSITNTSDGNTFQSYEIVFRTPIGPLRAGTTYYLNFECDAENNRRFLLRYDNDNNYPGGTYYDEGSDDRNDIAFQVSGSIVSETAIVTIEITPRSETLTLTSQQVTPSGFGFEVSGPPSSTYVIYASSDFVNWIPLFTNYSASGRMPYLDIDAPKFSGRFYSAESH